MGKPSVSVTHGQVATAAGRSLSYTATAGYLPLYKQGQQSGDVRACLFFFAYTRDDHAGDASWPVAFLFNGGPGSPSDWVHLGGMGPKALSFGPEGIDAGSAAVSDDPLTLLASADLVFIDPINTGFSRPATGVDVAEYNGLQQDATSIGDFIQGYLAKFQRTASPKYLVGESYAGMRIPVLGRYLDEKLGIKLAGVTFISPWLDAMGDDYTDVADDLPYITYLPEFAATAWYHKKLAAPLQALTVQEVYAEALAFADGPYLSALAAGTELSAAERPGVVTRLSELTGLAPASIDAKNLRLTVDQFRGEVLKGTGETVAYYDARMKAVIADPTKHDPYDAFDPLFQTADAAYFTGTLGIATALPYATNNFKSWPGANPSGGVQGEYLTVLDDLNTLVAGNPGLKVNIASGLFDLVCPAAEVQYMVRHLRPEVAKRIEIHHYLAGHPVYFGTISHGQFTADMAEFIARPAPAAGVALATTAFGDGPRVTAPGAW